MHSTETVIMTCAVEHYPVAMDEETGLLYLRASGKFTLCRTV